MNKNKDSTKSIFNFKKEAEAELWYSVNDNVMGGISKGNISYKDKNYLVFSGSLSFEYNGGFASIRTVLKDNEVAGYKGLKIKVRGDGRKYQFRIRTSKNIDGIAYKQEFETNEGDWMMIDLPISSFVPTFRGRILNDVEPLTTEDIRQIGFLIADKKEGAFELTIDEITAYK